MDLRFVETLVLAVEEASLAAAARRLGITPAAVSQRIDALEAELKVPLLRRSGRGMAATPDAEALLPALRQMLALRQDLAQQLAQDQMTGVLRLGAIDTVLADHAAHVVQGLRDLAPAVTLTLVPGASARLYADVEAGRLDAAILVAPPFALPKALRFDVIEVQPIGLLTPVPADGARTSTPASGPDNTPATVQADLPFLLYDRTSWGGALCHRVLTRAVAGDQVDDVAGKQNRPQSTPQILAEMDALDTIAQLVADGVGQAIVPRWQALDRFAGKTVFTPIGQDTRQIGLLRRQSDAGRALQKTLLDLLRMA